MLQGIFNSFATEIEDKELLDKFMIPFNKLINFIDENNQLKKFVIPLYAEPTLNDDSGLVITADFLANWSWIEICRW